MKTKEEPKGEVLAGSSGPSRDRRSVCLQAGRQARTAGQEKEIKKHVMSTQGKWGGVEIKNKITAGQAKSKCVRSSSLPTPQVCIMTQIKPQNEVLRVSGTAPVFP